MNDPKTLPAPLALANEPHHDHSAFFDEAELPKGQRRILKNRTGNTTTRTGFDQAMTFFGPRVDRKDVGGRFNYTWKPATLLLTGAPGKGKTTIACDYADRVMRLGYRTFYTDAHEMLRRYEHPQLDIDTFQGQMLASRLLIIDNFEGLLPGQEGSLMSWVKRRNDDEKWTIICADYTEGVPFASVGTVDYCKKKGLLLNLS